MLLNTLVLLTQNKAYNRKSVKKRAERVVLGLSKKWLRGKLCLPTCKDCPVKPDNDTLF